MCYYYTIKEYASIKGITLSVQEEAKAAACATLLSNERGVLINKIHCRNSGSKQSCYATRILRETFKLSGKKNNRWPEKDTISTPA